MPLEPQVQTLIDNLAAAPTFDMSTVTPAQMRETMGALFAAGDAPVIPSTDTSVAGPAGDIPVRVYEPAGSSADGPTLLWYHGGGWVIGDLESTDGPCRRLAAAAGMRIVSVEYRLAPEHRYPAGVEDAHAAFTAVAEGKLGGPPSWIGVGGDSAGGNLAAVECLVARERGGRQPDFQLLVYPATDLAMDSQSQRDNGAGYLLTTTTLRWFREQYLDPVHFDDPFASPLRAPSLDGLPPAYVVTAGYDPLRDEGEAYAARLREAGVPARTVRYDGQIHGFFGSPDVFGPSAQVAVEAAAAALRAAASG
jgi:acetyl esterase